MTKKEMGWSVPLEKKLGYLPWEKLLWLWPKTYLPRSLRKWRKNSVECQSQFGRSQIFLSKCLDLQHHSSKRWGFNNIYVSTSVPLISSILCSRSWNICDSYSLLMRAMSLPWHFQLSKVQGEATRLFLTYCEEITNSKAHPVLSSEVLAQIRPPAALEMRVVQCLLQPDDRNHSLSKVNGPSVAHSVGNVFVFQPGALLSP